MNPFHPCTPVLFVDITQVLSYQQGRTENPRGHWNHGSIHIAALTCCHLSAAERKRVTRCLCVLPLLTHSKEGWRFWCSTSCFPCSRCLVGMNEPCMRVVNKVHVHLNSCGCNSPGPPSCWYSRADTQTDFSMVAHRCQEIREIHNLYTPPLMFTAV